MGPMGSIAEVKSAFTSQVFPGKRGMSVKKTQVERRN